MSSPLSRLNNFEANHGCYDDLLHKMINENDEIKKQEFNALLRWHNTLIWMLIGYNEGYKKGHRDVGKEKAAEG